MSGQGVGSSLGSLAIVATRGTSNSLFQVATLVRAATALGAKVDVLFRDEALRKLERDRLNVAEWAPVYSRIERDLVERLRAAEFVDMETFLRDAKQHGDDVRFWVAQECIEEGRVAMHSLIPLVDGARSGPAFDLIARAADAVLIF